MDNDIKITIASNITDHINHNQMFVQNGAAVIWPLKAQVTRIFLILPELNHLPGLCDAATH